MLNIKLRHFEMKLLILKNTVSNKQLKQFVTYFEDLNPNNRESITIQIGWTLFVLKKEKDAYTLYSPDYLNNPFESLSNDVTLAIQIHFEQVKMLNLLNLLGESSTFNQKIVFQKGVFESADFYLERILTEGNDDSGWFVGFLDKEEEEFEAIYAYELLTKKPDLLQLLLFPYESLIVVKNNTIIKILDKNDEELFSI